MDVHGAGVVRRSGVVIPVVVREPGIWGRNRHEFPAPLVVEAVRSLVLSVKDGLDAWNGFQECLDRGDPSGIADVYVCQLMIGDSERRARSRIEGLGADLVPDGDQSCVA